jgi:hypothetical protein
LNFELKGTDAIGWDTVPVFPHSTDKDTFDYDSAL